MKRLFACIMTLGVLLAGCGTDTSSDIAASVSAEDIFSTLTEAFPGVDLQSGDLVIKLLGVDPDSVLSCNAAFAKDGGPGMVIVLETKDEDAALNASERMNYYLTTLQNSAAQYSPSDVAVLKNGYVYTSGPYAVLYVGEDVDAAKKELAELFH